MRHPDRQADAAPCRTGRSPRTNSPPTSGNSRAARISSPWSRSGEVTLGSVSIDPKSRFDGRREVFYSFLPEHWGQGYAREAVTAVVGWAFEHVPSDDPSVIAVTQEANSRSRRLLEAIGMRAISDFVEWGASQVMYSVRGEELCG